jgi:hypothetical protein
VLKDGISFVGNMEEHHKVQIVNVEIDSSTTKSGEKVIEVVAITLMEEEK